MRPLVPTAAAVAALALGGCAATPGRVAAPAAPAAPAASSPAPPTTSRPPGTPTVPATRSGPTTTGSPAVLTLAFAGDVHFEDHLQPVGRDPHGLDALRSTLGAADLSVVNLETALTTRGTRIGKEFHFRAPASALTTLANAGVDAVSMANNHGVDFGPVGLRDTLAAKRTSPLPVVGIGADEDEAFAPATLTAKGVRVAVLGASQVHEMTLLRYSADAHSGGIASSAPVTRLRAAVERARSTHDLVVVFMHWGTDYQQCPDVESVATARALERAGADVVVGGHSHRVNGAGWLGRAYVDYGLGNFVWWRSREPDSRSGVLRLSVDIAAAKARHRGSSVVRDAQWTPMLIGRDGLPRVPGSADARRLHRLWDDERACTGLGMNP